MFEPYQAEKIPGESLNFLLKYGRHKNFLSFFLKKWNYKILDLGESSNFLSIAPHFFFQKKILIKGFFWGP